MLRSNFVWSSFYDKKSLKYGLIWAYIISGLNGEEIAGTFYENKLQKKSLELKKKSREKAINYMLNGKGAIICLIDGLIKRT